MGHCTPRRLRAAGLLLVLPFAATAGNASLEMAQTESGGSRAAPRSGTTHAIPLDRMPLPPGKLDLERFRAVQAGDLEMLRRLLERGGVPHGLLLIKAAQDGNAGIVRLLLEAGAKVDARDNETRTALIYAAQAGHAEIVRMLLEKGANPSARIEYLWEPSIHGTPRYRYRENRMSALMHAAQGGHTQIVAALAAAGAKVNAKSYYDETALMYAADKGRTETVAKLLELGADLQASADSREKKIEAQSFGYSYGGTALDYAVRGKNPATAKALLAEHARRKKPAANAEPAFYYALHTGDLELVRRLADEGRVDTRKVYLLTTAGHSSSPEIFKFMLDRLPAAQAPGARLDPNILISAAGSKSLVKVQMALERGADINGRDKHGQNALYYAVYYGAPDAVGYLLGKGIEVNVTGDISLGTSGQGDTALALAVQKGELEIVKQLLAKGADVNLKRTPGKSALDVAKEIGRTDVLLLLGDGKPPR